MRIKYTVNKSPFGSRCFDIESEANLGNTPIVVTCVGAEQHENGDVWIGPYYRLNHDQLGAFINMLKDIWQEHEDAT